MGSTIVPGDDFIAASPSVRGAFIRAGTRDFLSPEQLATLEKRVIAKRKQKQVAGKETARLMKLITRSYERRLLKVLAPRIRSLVEVL